MEIETKNEVCEACGTTKTRVEVRNVTQSFRGEELQVETPVTICGDCNFQFLDSGQFDELRRHTADAYRRKHLLLTSQQIILRRKLLEMTQEQFAQYLSVGVASVKRWETWLVQDKRNDQTIREKTDHVVLMERLKSAYRNAAQTPKMVAAYNQIVEGEVRIQEGVVNLLDQLVIGSNQWSRFLVSTVEVNYVPDTVKTLACHVRSALTASVEGLAATEGIFLVDAGACGRSGTIKLESGRVRNHQSHRIYEDQNAIESAA